MTNTLNLTCVIALTATLMSGCGGSDTPAPATNNTSAAVFNLTAAAQNSDQQQSFTLVGTAPDGSQATMLASSIYGGTTTFEGVLVDYDVNTTTLKQGSALLSSGSYFSFYSNNPRRWRGGVSSDGSDYTVATSSWSMPATAKVGDSGPRYNATEFFNSNKTLITGYESATWSLETDTPSTAWFCSNREIFDHTNTKIGTTASCKKITPDGSILARRATVRTPIGTVIFQ